MRRAAVIGLAVAALAACSKEESGDPAAKAAAAPAQAKEDNRIRCAIAGSEEFAPTCTREVASGPDGPIWIVRHSDGGFRRFVLLDKGMRIATADGAAEVQARQRGPDLEVQVGTDRYLFAAAADAPIR